MNDSWRFRPGHGNICSVCSTRHFPFCSPPLPFDRSEFSAVDLHRHSLETHPPFFRPLYTPSFPDRRMLQPPPPPPPPPPRQHPYVESLKGNDFMGGGESFGRPFQPPQRLFQEEFLERENNLHKRMRMEEDRGLGYPTAQSQPLNRHDHVPGRISYEDERRLNLIRNHGRQTTPPFTGDLEADHSFRGLGFDSISGSGPDTSPNPPFLDQQNPNQSLQTRLYEGYRNIPATRNTLTLISDRLSPQEMNDFQRREWDSSKVSFYNSPNPDRTFLSKNYMAHHHLEQGDDYKNNLREQPPVDSSHKHYGSHISDDGRDGFEEEICAYRREQQQLQQMRSIHVPEKNPHHYPNASFYEPHLPTGMENYGQERFVHLGKVPHYVENKNELHGQLRETSHQTFDYEAPLPEDIHSNFPVVEQSSSFRMSNQRSYLPLPTGSRMSPQNPEHTSHTFLPIPPQPIPKPHPEPSPSDFHVSSSFSTASPSVNPVPSSSSANVLLPSAVQTPADSLPSSVVYPYSEAPVHPSTGFATERQRFIHQAPLKHYADDGQAFPLKHSLTDKPTVVDASHIFRQPHRATRPDHIVIILRGLPGSGKSYLAKALRDLEVEKGGNAPRIHSMDDYFMTEVEKVEDDYGSKSSSSVTTVKGKKQIYKKVLEYCYEPEMEEAYRSSMLKAFRKTLEEGIFTFIIVDDRNLRVADFAQFWAIAKRSGYEVYLLEATYKDPLGCAARNVHGFTSDDIQKMAQIWEEAPPLYLQLDIQSLFHGDDLNDSSIQEVDMDTEDAACDDNIAAIQDSASLKEMEHTFANHTSAGSSKVGERWDNEGEDPTEVKELGRSKWSENLDEDIDRRKDAKGHLNALSGLIQAYGKTQKSVRWGDQVEKRGFSIGAIKKESISSLIIGPGSGYNLNSNPFSEEVNTVDERNDESRKHSVFLEHQRAERESFRVVFDRRRQRIGGLYVAEDE